MFPLLAALSAHAFPAAPALEVSSWIEGEPVAIPDDGVVVVELWATWCGPCIEAMPHLSQLAEHYDGQVAVAAVSDENVRTVRSFMSRRADFAFSTGVDPSGKTTRRFQSIEARHGFDEFLKGPDFGLSRAVLAWADGCTMQEFTHLAGADGGDVVRTLRMAIQMMRQLRSALSGDYALLDRLAEAIVAVNRDAVDAKRQFELG